MPNYKFMPKFKKRQWNGKIYLYNLRTRKIYKGLVPYIEKYCEENGYDFISELNEYETPVSLLEVENFLQTLK